jgi:hypothetical protein
MLAQGNMDGGKAALHSLFDAGAQCYDLGTHKGYNFASRPSELDAWVDYLLAVPHAEPPAGDPLGGWDDVVCMRD